MDETPPKRVNQRDVAKAAGVHRTTVCLALKNHPSIPVKTRERIAGLAKQMGYVPDPMLAALASYRTRLRPRAFQGSLAWLINSAGGFEWSAFPHYREYHQGAVERAKFHGYNLELFDINSPGMMPARLFSILRARYINGVLLCPQPKAGTTLACPWEQVSAVTFGYKLSNPCLHTVTAAHHRNMVRAMRELQSRGYCRIGFAFSRGHDEGTDRNYLAGYLNEMIGYETNKRLPIPPFLESFRRKTAGVKAWLRKYKPDAIVTGEYQAFEILTKAGIRIPEELGVACATLPSDRSTKLAGVLEDSVRIGAIAVDLLVAAIQQGEKGVPEYPVRHLVEGIWHEGDTLRPPAKSCL
jgi:LacI family transcriptional regulator/LacI family repressor for deo operon, udp, cdd, tsx, nupC, and nupG